VRNSTPESAWKNSTTAARPARGRLSTPISTWPSTPPTSRRLEPQRLRRVGRRRNNRGRNSDGRDGKRTGNTGQLRSLTVNNGHSKFHADLGRNALTRLGEDLLVGVRFPPAPPRPKTGIYQGFYTKW
jgi:hypothetical protein